MRHGSFAAAAARRWRRWARPEDLRGKKIALNSIGGTGWMGVLFWLEHLGLDQSRDQISMQVLGDQPIMMHAVETGIADAAALDGVFSKILREKGFTVLGEAANLAQRTVGQAMVVPHAFLSQRPDVVEAYLKAEIEALASPSHRRTNRR